MSKIKDKLNKVVSRKSSEWLAKAEWQISNEGWLDKSAKIALKRLRTIREKDITQWELSIILKLLLIKPCSLLQLINLC
jgi:hypothetical protein